MLEYYPSTEGEAAVDEAGRGCLAFDVCAAAVVFPPYEKDDMHNRVPPETFKSLSRIKDSKKMSAATRDRLSDFIKSFATAYGIGTCSPAEIDELNILHATHLAMHRALDAVSEKLRIKNIVIDGTHFQAYFPPKNAEIDCDGYNDDDAPLWLPHACVPQGDATHVNIAAASILAKTHRDKLVESYCSADPSLDQKYAFLSNKAYGTARHLEGLRLHGATNFHRKTYAPVTRVLASSSMT